MRSVEMSFVMGMTEEGGTHDIREGVLVAGSKMGVVVVATFGSGREDGRR